MALLSAEDGRRAYTSSFAPFGSPVKKLVNFAGFPGWIFSMPARPAATIRFPLRATMNTVTLRWRIVDLLVTVPLTTMPSGSVS